MDGPSRMEAVKSTTIRAASGYVPRGRPKRWFEGCLLDELGQVVADGAAWALRPESEPSTSRVKPFQRPRMSPARRLTT